MTWCHISYNVDVSGTVCQSETNAILAKLVYIMGYVIKII